MEIRWAEIEAECGSYRDGFVAIFRKYEGQATDEKDGNGRTVFVTVTSFARHVGIHDDTFRRWVNIRAARFEPPRDRVAEGIRNLSPERKAEVARELIKSEPEVRKAIVEDQQTYQRLSQARVEHVVEQADRGDITRQEFAEGMRQAYDQSALLQLSKVQERLGSLIARFQPEDFAQEVTSEREADGLVKSLTYDIDFLTAVRDAVKTVRTPRLVSRSS